MEPSRPMPSSDEAAGRLDAHVVRLLPQLRHHQDRVRLLHLCSDEILLGGKLELLHRVPAIIHKGAVVLLQIDRTEEVEERRLFVRLAPLGDEGRPILEASKIESIALGFE